MVTLFEDAAQGEFEIVQAKIFAPTPSPVIVVLFKVGELIVPIPETKVHEPVPTAGIFPAMVADELVQIF